MKQLKRRIFALVLSVSLLLLSGMTAFASGEGNIDGGAAAWAAAPQRMSGTDRTACVSQ